MGRQKLRIDQILADGDEGDVPVITGGELVYSAGGGGSATPSGPAAGVLSGTYPNPGFAVDMATQAELDAAIAAATAGSAGELLMQDGVSSPPVPLETEDGTDWLYEG